jgi:O-antigen/teichoic acid export membrane protein
VNLWQVGGSLLGLAGVIVGVYMHAGLPFLVAALAGAPLVATALNSVHFFVIDRPDLMPRARFVSRETISRIVTMGTMFFVMQLVISVAYSADNIIIARALGAASVPDYSIPQRMFSLITLMINMMIMPLWPAYGEAIARGDRGWAQRTLKRSLIVVFGATTLASVAMLLLASRLISWWIGPGISPPFLLLLGLALWTVVECCGNTLSVFLNGANLMRIQALVAGLFGIACLLLKVILIHRFGIAAGPWATLLTYVPIVGFACVVYLPGALKNLYCAPNPVIIATPVVEN